LRAAMTSSVDNDNCAKREAFDGPVERPNNGRPP
jgi:hypothetical protein